MRKIAVMCVWLAAVGLSFGEGKTPVSTFTDKRDGKVYKIVNIGSQTWFAENLNYAAKGSVCYDNDAENCASYGRLYDWNTAQKACPADTHLPADKDWTALTDYVGGSKTAGTKLKSTSGWYNNGNGMDEYDFSALSGGYCYVGDFGLAGFNGYWWSSTENDAGVAWYRNMGCYNEYVGRFNYDKNYLMSVRCVLDDKKEKQK